MPRWTAGTTLQARLRVPELMSTHLTRSQDVVKDVIAFAEVNEGTTPRATQLQSPVQIPPGPNLMLSHDLPRHAILPLACCLFRLPGGPAVLPILPNHSHTCSPNILSLSDIERGIK